MFERRRCISRTPFSTLGLEGEGVIEEGFEDCSSRSCSRAPAAVDFEGIVAAMEKQRQIVAVER